MTDQLERLLAAVNDELAHVRISADAPNDDEPVRPPYVTRRQSLRRALVTLTWSGRRSA